MTIKNLYPSQRPSIIYNVINGRPELPLNATFSRAERATYIDIAGNIQYAEVDVPRFDYDSKTGEFNGLLLEDAKANLFKSSDFSNLDTKGYYLTGDKDWEGLGTQNTVWGEFPMPGQNPMYCYCDLLPDLTKRYYLSVFVRFTTDHIPEPDSGKYYFSFVWQNFQLESNRAVWTRVGENMYQVRIAPTNREPNQKNCGIIQASPSKDYGMEFTGFQVEIDGYSSYIKTTNAARARVPDELSLTTIRNFDSGFSLLLDSETTTDDFIYKIKSDGTEIASLSNDGGTLDWTINGKSAAINGEYPQVGFLPGRVRTISSFGPAEQGDVENYLYTTGLSFPTTAEPAAGADEIEFGVPQTLKALYVWDGQLDETNAVSLIRGKYNVVPNKPINIDAFSFVYNSDPTNAGNVDITLPSITPTVSMRVDWGDGNSNAYEKGIIPSHTYPYPGQYRIQITADDGFDVTKLQTKDTITQLDQWAPQYRVGASGDGFTGDDLRFALYQQRTLTSTIPPFKYTNLTSLESAFFQLSTVDTNNWDWVPYDIPNVTSLKNAFYQTGLYTVAANGDAKNFPRLITGPALTSVEAAFYQTGINGWINKESGDSVTISPFTDTSNVTNWNNCFIDCGITDIDVDTEAAVSMDATFAGNAFEIFPSINLGNCTSLSSTWARNKMLTRFPGLDARKVINFSSAWNGCEKLTAFERVNTSSGTNFAAAWFGCKELTTFPEIDISNGNNFRSAWQACEKIDLPASLDFTSATNIGNAFEGSNVTPKSNWNFPNVDYAENAFKNLKSGITSIPAYTFNKVKTMNGCFRDNASLTTVLATANAGLERLNGTFVDCVSLSAMPNFNVSTVWDFYFTFVNTAITEINASWDFSSGTDFGYMFRNCRSLATIPAGMFDSIPAVLSSNSFGNTFLDCALTVDSISNLIKSIDASGTTGAYALSIEGGTNAPRYQGSSGTTLTPGFPETEFNNLLSKGWSIAYNKYTGENDVAEPTFYVLYDSQGIQFIETSGTVESGKLNRKTFTDESEAIACVLEIDDSYFPEWDRSRKYEIGERIKFGNCIFRALKYNDAIDFQLPDLESDPDAEIPTPMNRQARWEMVCNPEFETLTNDEESY